MHVHSYTLTNARTYVHLIAHARVLGLFCTGFLIIGLVSYRSLICFARAHDDRTNLQNRCISVMGDRATWG